MHGKGFTIQGTMTTNRNHPKDSQSKDPPRRSSRLKDRAIRQEATAALSTCEEKESEQSRATSISLHGKAKTKGKSSEPSNKSPASKSPMTHAEIVEAAVISRSQNCESSKRLYRPNPQLTKEQGEISSQLRSDIEQMKTQHPEFSKEIFELDSLAMCTVPYCLDQRHSDGLMQDALLKIRTIADSLQGDERCMEHWQAAITLAQRLGDQRKASVNFLTCFARRREMTTKEIMEEMCGRVV